MDFLTQIKQLGVPVVTTARALTVSAPLTGGGDLSADRALGLAIDTTLRIVSGQLGVSTLVALASHTHTPAAIGAEPALGNPATNAYVLTSTTAGLRSWAVPTVAWANVTGEPTTIAGYGITDAPTKTGSGASGTWAINVTGASAGAPASGISGQTGMWTSAARPGPYRLYRRDADNAYSVQTTWTGTYWRLDGYNGDTLHAGCSVAYADNALSAYGVAWSGVSSRPSTLAGFGITDGMAISGGSTAGGVNLTCSYFAVNATHYIGTDVKFGGHFAVGSPQAYPTCRIHTIMEADTSGYYGLIINNAANTANRLYVRGDGVCWVGVAWTVGSDRTLKQDIAPEVGALQRLMGLSPVRYRLREDVERDGEEARVRHGLIAQEVLETWPELVTASSQIDDCTLLGIDYTALIGPLIGAVQELTRRITSLESR